MAMLDVYLPHPRGCPTPVPLPLIHRSIDDSSPIERRRHTSIKPRDSRTRLPVSFPRICQKIKRYPVDLTVAVEMADF